MYGFWLAIMLAWSMVAYSQDNQEEKEPQDAPTAVIAPEASDQESTVLPAPVQSTPETPAASTPAPVVAASPATVPAVVNPPGVLSATVPAPAITATPGVTAAVSASTVIPTPEVKKTDAVKPAQLAAQPVIASQPTTASQVPATAQVAPAVPQPGSVQAAQEAKPAVVVQAPTAATIAVNVAPASQVAVSPASKAGAEQPAGQPETKSPAEGSAPPAPTETSGGTKPMPEPGEKEEKPEEPKSPEISPEMAVSQPEATEEQLPEIIGIDTVNVESASGNWLLKRIWFERAQEQYEKTRALFDQVLELRFNFFAKRTELDRTLFEPFYMKIGIGQGELLEIINRLLQDLQEMRGKDGALSEQENILHEQVEGEKESLEKLQKDVANVTELDGALEAAISQLIEQVNVCRSYEKQAWETFKEIAKQLSDKKARELYYAMDTYRKNSANIVTYLQHDFANYIQTLENAAHEQIDRIMTAVEELKKKDVDFKEQAKRLEQKRFAKESPHHEEVTPEAPLEPESFMARAWSTVTDFVHTIWEALAAGVHGISSWIWPYEATAEQPSALKSPSSSTSTKKEDRGAR